MIADATGAPTQGQVSQDDLLVPARASHRQGARAALTEVGVLTQEAETGAGIAKPPPGPDICPKGDVRAIEGVLREPELEQTIQ